MKSPGAQTWLFGNVVVMGGLCLFFFFVGFRWLVSGEDYSVATIISGITASASYKAHEKLRRYQLWKREWNGMGGKAAWRGPSLGTVRKLAAVAAWFVGAWGSVAYATESGFAIPVALFWLGTLVMIVAGIVRLFRRGARPPRSRDVAVTVCLAKPAQSPDVRQAYAAIPDYCRRVGLTNG